MPRSATASMVRLLPEEEAPAPNRDQEENPDKNVLEGGAAQLSDLVRGPAVAGRMEAAWHGHEAASASSSGRSVQGLSLARGGAGAYDVAAGGLDALNEVSTPMYVFDGLVGEGDGGGPPAADGEAMRHVWANLPALKLMGLSSQVRRRPPRRARGPNPARGSRLPWGPAAG